MAEPTPATRRRPAGGDVCILAVDDDRNVARIISHVLGRHWCVLSAHSGSDALRILDTFEIDLLLTDVSMPEMDGLALADHARRKLPQLPVAFFSGCWDEVTTALAEERSPHILAKPFETQILLQRIQDILTGRSSDVDEIEKIGRTMSVASMIAQLKNAATSGQGLKVVVEDDLLAPDVLRGDVLHVMGAKESQLRRGDVLHCYHRDQTFTRRFVRMTDTQDAVMVVVRDALDRLETLPWGQIIGRAVRCERHGAKVRVRGVRDPQASWMAWVIGRLNRRV